MIICDLQVLKYIVICLQRKLKLICHKFNVILYYRSYASKNQLNNKYRKNSNYFLWIIEIFSNLKNIQKIINKLFKFFNVKFIEISPYKKTQFTQSHIKLFQSLLHLYHIYSLIIKILKNFRCNQLIKFSFIGLK